MERVLEAKELKRTMNAFAAWYRALSIEFQAFLLQRHQRVGGRRHPVTRGSDLRVHEALEHLSACIARKPFQVHSNALKVVSCAVRYYVDNVRTPPSRVRRRLYFNTTDVPRSERQMIELNLSKNVKCVMKLVVQFKGDAHPIEFILQSHVEPVGLLVQRMEVERYGDFLTVFFEHLPGRLLRWQNLTVGRARSLSGVTLGHVPQTAVGSQLKSIVHLIFSP